jgi:sugar fermentation stimulation protein A
LNAIIIYHLTNLFEGIFISRPNRFVSEILYRNKQYSAHVHDPGRLNELLKKGAQILFITSNGKLPYYLKAVKSGREWVLIDTALHNKIAFKVFNLIPELSQFKNIRKEVKTGKSRIDFSLDGIPLEVKGVTLVKDNIALFPDAPTERGLRHVTEIITHKGVILFLIFRNAMGFRPNFAIDPKFSKALSAVRKKGISIYTAKILFDGKNVTFYGSIPLEDF